MSKKAISFAWKGFVTLSLMLALVFPHVVFDPSPERNVRVMAMLSATLAGIAGFVMLIFGLIVGHVKQNWRVARTGIWLFAIIVLSFFIATFIIEMQYKHTVAIGSGLVDDIEAYRRDTGVYPASLDELVPRYREDIPATDMGLPGVYSFYYSNNDNGYWLAFMGGFPERCPKSADQNWGC